MRVLFYNWVDDRDPAGRGGGVSRYQRHVIDGLAARPGYDCAALSAGLAFDLRAGPPRVEPLPACDIPRYVLVNAGTNAPSHADFAGAGQLSHPPTTEAFAAFLQRTGPWDVVHFNNLEGLPAEVLALKSRFPATRFVLSLHNYYPLCPQVNLWHAEREACSDFRGGTRCATCLPITPDPRAIRMAYALEWRLGRLGLGPGTAAYRWLFSPLIRLGRRGLRMVSRRRAPAPALAPRFAERRATMVVLINAHCDAVLCVSERVRRIAVQHGIDARRLSTHHIGTRAAEAWAQTRPRESFLTDGILRLGYLGYMRRDKGYHFLMQALAALPPDIAGRLHLTVAARRGDRAAMALFDGLRNLAGLRHIDGYDHSALPAILGQIDVGIVPVMWEDNLPQVAIEMHAQHIPLITSDRGGAQELGRCRAMVFRAGDAASLQGVLQRVLDGGVTPADYWPEAMEPVTMARHLDALDAVYRGPARLVVSPSSGSAGPEPRRSAPRSAQPLSAGCR